MRYPLRQDLLLHILTMTLERAQKINQCKKGDKLLDASMKSQLLLEDRSWPFLQWCHQTKSLVINGKQPSIPMEEMINHLTTLVDLCKVEGTIVRFHSLRPPNSQEQVIPWKLDVDVKCHEVHVLIKKLAQSSLWQLVSVRIKPHSLQQSKLADQLQPALRPKRKTK